MTACPGREGTYVPWSSAGPYRCLMCGAVVVQAAAQSPLRGSGYEAVYPIPEHQPREA